MFSYNAPTRLFIECDINKLGSIISSYGYKNILFLYGGGSIKKTNLYDNIVDSLKEWKVNRLPYPVHTEYLQSDSLSG